MDTKYRIHNAPSPGALEQAARLGSTHAIIYSVGPCSMLSFEPDPDTGRPMDEFPLYFDDYPKVAAVRHAADAVWIERLKNWLRGMCDRAVELGIVPVIHLYEPMLPLSFEREYPELVGAQRRKTQMGMQEFHTLMRPDDPACWQLVEAKYRELANTLPSVGMFVVTTGDTASAYWCVPEAKMPVAERLAKMMTSAQAGVRAADSSATVCCRLWWRNFPSEYYRDGHRLTAEHTGLENASELMCQIGHSWNDPGEVLPALFEHLPRDCPIMYKSSRMDIHEHSPLTHVLDTYPADREQIMEISFEMYQDKPWPWCKVAHMRRGLEAVKEHGIAGYVSLSINMGNNGYDIDPERGNLGRMNTWLFEQLAKGDARSDRELVAAWLEKEYGTPAPSAAIDALLDAERLADEGIQWGQGINHRYSFASLHTTKLYWFYDGFIQPDFPYKIADPDAALIEEMIALKHAAHESARAHLGRIEATRAATAPELHEELHSGWVTFADYILLRRDWASYLLMQYGIERGVYPPDRVVLGRMSRYVETFIANLVRLRGTAAGQKAMGQIAFPDLFPLT